MRHSGDDIPDLAGCVCTAALCQQYWYRGQLMEEANAVYLQTDGRQWHRFFLDAGVLFWKTGKPPAPCNTNLSEEFHYPLTDVGEASGLLGRVITAVDVARQGESTSVKITFADGCRLNLHNEHDTTRLSIRKGY